MKLTHHLKKLEPSSDLICNYELRMFEGDNLRRDPETGQPWKGFFAICGLTVRGTDCEVRGLENLKHPMACFARLRGQVARELGLLTMWGERWDEATETKTIVQIRLSRLANSNPQRLAAPAPAAQSAPPAPSICRPAGHRRVALSRRPRLLPLGVG